MVRFRNDISAEQKNTVGYLKDGMIKSFYNSMMAARIRELMQQENPPFIGGSIGIAGVVRGYFSYNINVLSKPNEEALAWEAILRENERVKRYGFNDSELERVKTNMLAGLETSYKQKDKISNESYINGIKNHFWSRSQSWILRIIMN